MPTEPTPAASTPDEIDTDDKPMRGEGLLPFYIRRMFGRSWRTSMTGWGILLLSVGEQLADGGLPKTGADWIKLAVKAAIGIGFMGAKDKNVTGLEPPR